MYKPRADAGWEDICWEGYFVANNIKEVAEYLLINNTFGRGFEQTNRPDILMRKMGEEAVEQMIISEIQYTVIPSLKEF